MVSTVYVDDFSVHTTEGSGELVSLQETWAHPRTNCNMNLAARKTCIVRALEEETKLKMCSPWTDALIIGLPQMATSAGK